MPIHKDLEDYKRFRAAQIELNKRITARLPKESFLSGGEELGILKNGTLVFDSEEIVDVLADYCVYRYDDSGMNAVEKFFAEFPPEPDSGEQVLREAMLTARYSIFKIDKTIPGYGAAVTDFLYSDDGFIMDVGLSHSAMQGMVLAGRILPVSDSFSMSSGAMMPMDPKTMDYLNKELMPRLLEESKEDNEVSDQHEQIFEAETIRQLIINGVADRYRTHNIADDFADDDDDNVVPFQPAKPGRNEPCPCGSGKKYKHCCGR